MTKYTGEVIGCPASMSWMPRPFRPRSASTLQRPSSAVAEYKIARFIRKELRSIANSGASRRTSEVEDWVKRHGGASRSHRRRGPQRSADADRAVRSD